MLAPAAFGAAPGPGAFRPSSNVTTEVASTAAGSISGFAGQVQAGVKGVVQAAHAFAGSLIDQSAVTPAPETPAVALNGTSGYLDRATNGTAQAKNQATAKAAEVVESVKAAAPEVTSAAEQAVDAGKAKVAGLPPLSEVAAKVSETATGTAEQAKAAVVAALPEAANGKLVADTDKVRSYDYPLRSIMLTRYNKQTSHIPGEWKAEEATPIPTPALAATPPALAPEIPIAILPVAAPIPASAPEAAPSTSVPVAAPVPGASTAEEPIKPEVAAIPAEQPSTHAPVKFAAAKEVSPVATPAAVDTPSVKAASVAVPAAPATPAEVPLPDAPTEPEVPKTVEAAPAVQATPVDAPDVVATPVDIPAAPAAPAETPPSTTLVAPEAPKTPEAAPAEKVLPAPVAAAAAASTSVPAGDAPAHTNGKAEPPRSLPTASANGTIGTSQASTLIPPVTPTKKSFPKGGPDTPGSQKSTVSSRFGSSRKKRSSFFGKIKEIFHHEHDEDGEKKEKKKEGRKSRQSVSG